MAQTFKRHEKKYIIDNEVMSEILENYKKHLVLDDNSGPDGVYSVYSIYFDTKNNDIIRNSISKPIYKEKLRLRSYKLDPSPNDTIYLELKKKYDGIGNKRRIKLTYSEALKLVKDRIYPTYDDYESNQILNEIKNFIFVNRCTPKILIGTKRIAYYDKLDPSFRLTFDFDMFFRQSKLDFIGGENIPLLKDEIVMEVKFKDSMPYEFTRMMSDLGYSSRPCSKYGKAYTQIIKKR